MRHIRGLIAHRIAGEDAENVLPNLVGGWCIYPEWVGRALY